MSTVARIILGECHLICWNPDRGCEIKHCEAQKIAQKRVDHSRYRQKEIRESRQEKVRVGAYRQSGNEDVEETEQSKKLNDE